MSCFEHICLLFVNQLMTLTNECSIAWKPSIGGKVTVRGEEFFLSNEQGELEFTLLAEGWRKLGFAVAVDTEWDAAGWLSAVLG